jgi:tRNA threonylcarbamoyladenosine biosynthesis protein TsaB
VNILALETSTEQCSVALQSGDMLVLRHVHAGQSHSELILPMVKEVLDEAQLQLSQVDGIAFGAGPGSFTGLRIACGVAQGLAFGVGIRVAPIGTLLALAEATRATRVIACLDARMGEIYHAAYQLQAEGWEEVSAPVVCRAESAPMLSGADWLGCGSGFAAYPEALAQRYRGQLKEMQPDLFPNAREIAKLASPAFAKGATLAAEAASPIYVRDRVALTSAEQKR